jgi:nucleoside-diphosphate-sugar epimerase
MHCLVTGVAGFIGSSIAERLIGEGHNVIGVDCFTDYYSREIKESNIAGLKNEKRFELIEADLVKLDLNNILKNVSVVFHQAAQAGVRASWGSYFETYIAHNITATQKLLESAKQFTNIQKIVYASSSSVYGDAESFPTSEKMVPKPVSPYGVTKLAAEHLMCLYSKSYGLPTCSLRYFTVYGPKQRPEMAFSKFITAALKKEKLLVYGDGTQSRDFTFIDDIVEANILASKKGTNGGVYNIGGGVVASLKDVFAILTDLIGTLDIEYTEKQRGDAYHTSADTSLAKAELGFSPKVSLAEGLKRQTDWIRSKI